MLGTQQFASAAVPGKLVGPKDQFGDSPQMANCFADFNSHSSTQRDKGPWVNVANRYLGFKFSISGQTHYAWARVSTGGFPCFPNGTLTGYAYETIPNQPIFAGVSLNPTGSPAIPEGTPAEEPKATTNQKSSGAASLGVLATGAAGLDVWRR